MNKTKKINLDYFKRKVTQIAKQYSYDFCTDMYKELRYFADEQSLSDIEVITNDIRLVEQFSEQQIHNIHKAKCITDVLEATILDSSAGNILFENEELIFSIMYDCYYWDVDGTDDELPF